LPRRTRAPNPPDEPKAHADPAHRDARGPQKPETDIALAVRHNPAPLVDDDQLLRRNDRNDRRRRDAPNAPPARPHLEQRRIVRIVVRQHPLDRAVAAPCEREADTVDKPVAGDGAGRGEPLAPAQSNRHPGPGTPLPRHAKLLLVTNIAELEENRTIEGVYAVARKERLRTRNGSTYLALELVDPSGRIGARIWNDVDLLDGRFEAGDA